MKLKNKFILFFKKFALMTPIILTGAWYKINNYLNFIKNKNITILGLKE